MINKLEFPLWLIFHPAALNYNRAIKEGFPLVVNSERLQKKIPGLPMISVQELFGSGQTDELRCITWLYQLPFCFSSKRSAISLYWWWWWGNCSYYKCSDMSTRVGLFVYSHSESILRIQSEAKYIFK